MKLRRNIYKADGPLYCSGGWCDDTGDDTLIARASCFNKRSIQFNSIQSSPIQSNPIQSLFFSNTTETATPTLRTLFLIDDRFDLILFALLRFFLSSRFLSFFVSGGRYRNECSRKNSERGQGNLISRLALVALPKNEVVYLYTQFQFLRYYQFL